MRHAKRPIEEWHIEYNTERLPMRCTTPSGGCRREWCTFPAMEAFVDESMGTACPRALVVRRKRCGNPAGPYGKGISSPRAPSRSRFLQRGRRNIRGGNSLPHIAPRHEPLARVRQVQKPL